jgi:hypothetical protein
MRGGRAEFVAASQPSDPVNATEQAVFGFGTSWVRLVMQKRHFGSIFDEEENECLHDRFTSRLFPAVARRKLNVGPSQLRRVAGCKQRDPSHCDP